MKPIGYFVLACAAIALIGWIVSKLTGSRAYFIEEGRFRGRDGALARRPGGQLPDPESGTGGRHVVRAHATRRRGGDESAHPDRRAPALGKEAHGPVGALSDEGAGSDRLDGGLLSVGYQTLVFDPGSLDVHEKDAKPYVDLTPASGETSSTNLQTIRIFTDDAAGFRLP